MTKLKKRKGEKKKGKFQELIKPKDYKKKRKSKTRKEQNMWNSHQATTSIFGNMYTKSSNH